jgi:hypothetical protein
MTSSTERRNPAPARPWERHLQTIMTGLVLAAIVWNYKALDEVRLTMATTAVELRALKERVEYQMRDRFTATQASGLISELSRLGKIVAMHEDRLDAIDVKIAGRK